MLISTLTSNVILFLIVKALLIVAIISFTILAGKTYATGREASKLTVPYLFVRSHKKNARRLFWYLFFAVCVIECMVRFGGGVKIKDALFITHVTVASLSFILFFLLNWPLTGLKKPHIHKYIAYSSLVLFLITILTAIPIILRM